MSVHPVILAGGSGTRLWPLSREYFPKPFLNLTGDHSLFQGTILRLDGIEGISHPVVVCNEEHRFLVAEQAREIGRPPLSIILEPVSRNTAPAPDSGCAGSHRRGHGTRRTADARAARRPRD